MSNFFTGIAGEENEQKAKTKISRVQISGLMFEADKYLRDRKSWKMKGTVLTERDSIYLILGASFDEFSF